MVDEILFLELPVEEREQVMRDNCDQILERSYAKKFNQEEINARRKEYADVGIQVAELEKQLAEVRADYKGRIKPLLEPMSLQKPTVISALMMCWIRSVKSLPILRSWKYNR